MTTPTPTRLTAKGQATRDRIVAAAAAEVFERGVANTSLDDVKAAAGVSSSQLYHYFADKHALVLAVIEHQSAQILRNQEPLLDQLDSIRALRRWRDLILDVQASLECRGGCPLGTMGAELAETDEDARIAIGDGLAVWEGRIRDGLRTMRDRGELKGDPDRLALALFTALQGGLGLTQIRRDSTALAVALDTVIDHIESLTTKPARSSRR